MKILIVEDEPNLRLGLTEAITAEGWEPLEASRGAEADKLLRSHTPDLILLDVMLPGKTGFELCREWRAGGLTIPILFLTAKGQEIDKVLGLELGADDYITKPFSLRELAARIRAVARRSKPQPESVPTPAQLAFGGVQIDCAALRGKRGSHAFELTPRELAVLNVLFQHRGEAVSRDHLLNQVWGVDYYGTTRTLDQVMVKLRQKIESRPANPRHLLTVHGLGYRLEV